MSSQDVEAALAAIEKAFGLIPPVTCDETEAAGHAGIDTLRAALAEKADPARVTVGRELLGSVLCLLGSLSSVAAVEAADAICTILAGPERQPEGAIREITEDVLGGPAPKTCSMAEARRWMNKAKEEGLREALQLVMVRADADNLHALAAAIEGRADEVASWVGWPKPEGGAS